MSFWSMLGDAAKATGKYVANLPQEAEAYVEEWADKDDEFLMEQLRNNYGAKYLAAAKLLKERGYGNHSND